MLDDELEVNLIFFKKKNGSDQRRRHMAKPHALSHKVSAFIYIYIYSKSYFIKSYFIPRYKKGEKIIIDGSFSDLMMTGKWPD